VSKLIKDNSYILYMSYSCEKCNYQTNRPENYKRHILSLKHNKIDDQEATCAYCKKTFKHTQSMYRHIKYTCKKKQGRRFERTGATDESTIRTTAKSNVDERPRNRIPKTTKRKLPKTY